LCSLIGKAVAARGTDDQTPVKGSKRKREGREDNTRATGKNNMAELG